MTIVYLKTRVNYNSRCNTGFSGCQIGGQINCFFIGAFCVHFTHFKEICNCSAANIRIWHLCRISNFFVLCRSSSIVNWIRSYGVIFRWFDNTFNIADHFLCCTIVGTALIHVNMCAVINRYIICFQERFQIINCCWVIIIEFNNRSNMNTYIFVFIFHLNISVTILIYCRDRNFIAEQIRQIDLCWMKVFTFWTDFSCHIWCQRISWFDLELMIQYACFFFWINRQVVVFINLILISRKIEFVLITIFSTSKPHFSFCSIYHYGESPIFAVFNKSASAFRIINLSESQLICHQWLKINDFRCTSVWWFKFFKIKR